MKIKLHRFSFFLNAKAYRTVLIIILSLLSAYGIALIVNFENVILPFCVMTVLCAVYLILSAFFQMLEMPSYIQVRNGVISYTAWKSGIGSRIALFRFSRATYTVSDFTKFELKQTNLEKKFDIGHIEFSGKTVWDVGEHTEKMNSKDVYIIYGIPNFKKFSQEIFDIIHIGSDSTEKTLL